MGTLFNGEFIIADLAGNTWDWVLAGTAVPEPSTIALFVLGLGGLVWARRRARPAGMSAGVRCDG
jgi:hypothetical protein